MTEADPDMMRVLFRLEQDEDGYPPFAEEVLLARALSERVCEIVSIPFFVEGLSKGDLISFSVPEGGEAEFDELLSARGHSTIRVIFFDSSRTEQLVRQLVQAGCVCEFGKVPDLISVDIPPAVGYRSVADILRAGANQDFWDYEEACVAQEHRT